MGMLCGQGQASQASFAAECGIEPDCSLDHVCPLTFQISKARRSPRGSNNLKRSTSRLGTRRAFLGYQLADPDYCRRQPVLSSASDTVHTQKLSGPATWNGDEMNAIIRPPKIWPRRAVPAHLPQASSSRFPRAS